jgi:hypothetical protein
VQSELALKDAELFDLARNFLSPMAEELESLSRTLEGLREALVSWRRQKDTGRFEPPDGGCCLGSSFLP